MSTGVWVRAENVVDLPTFGFPTSPILILSPYAKQGTNPQGNGRTQRSVAEPDSSDSPTGTTIVSIPAPEPRILRTVVAEAKS